MKNQITLLFLAMCFACSKANAQFVNATPSNIGSPTGTDYVFDPSSVSSPTYNRLGHLQSGTYGNAWSEWSAIGVPNFADGPVGPNNNSYYGLTVNSSSDRAFFGVRNEGYNQANTILAFGDNADSAPVPNRLIFEFDGWASSQDREIATMLANGNVGIGDSVPTCLLHVNCTNPVPSTPSNVRFANLQSGSGNYLTIDDDGYVLNSGIPLSSCSNIKEQLQKQIDELKARLDAMSTGTPDVKTGTQTVNELYQNTPNPFHTETTISYYIAKMNRSAGIMISDLNGKQLSKYPVTVTGNGSITVKVADMAPGVYLYTLIVDGVASDSKRMVVEGE